MDWRAQVQAILCGGAPDVHIPSQRQATQGNLLLHETAMDFIGCIKYGYQVAESHEGSR
jgi:hypothetical protein